MGRPELVQAEAQCSPVNLLFRRARRRPTVVRAEAQRRRGAPSCEANMASTVIQSKRFAERVVREKKTVAKWSNRYGKEFGLDEQGRSLAAQEIPPFKDVSVAVVIMGGTLSVGSEPGKMLVTRVERGMAE